MDRSARRDCSEIMPMTPTRLATTVTFTRPKSRRRLPATVACACMILCVASNASSLHAQSHEQQAQQHAPLSMSHIVRMLSDEAQQSKRDGVLMRSSANFASDDAWRHAPAPPPVAVLDRIARRNDTDPFIDAYIRWQLTSFKPVLDTTRMSDREFERLVQGLPAVIHNPRADQALIDAFQRAASLGTLSEQQQVEMNNRLNGLAQRSSHVHAFNVPASQLHEWHMQQFANQPHRVLVLMLHRAHALAEAGWPVEEFKRSIDTQIARFARMREFTIQQRRAVALRAESSMARARIYLEIAGVTEGAAYVNFNTTGIFDYDVRRWARALADEQ